jgi:ribosome-binding factor A
MIAASRIDRPTEEVSMDAFLKALTTRVSAARARESRARLDVDLGAAPAGVRALAEAMAGHAHYVELGAFSMYAGAGTVVGSMGEAIGFVTLTRVKVSPDLQLARVYYTSLGDERARVETRRALERATPFLRRHLGARLRLRRVPDLTFQFDQSVEQQDRIEQILLDLADERRERGEADGPRPPEPDDDGGDGS